LLVDSEPASIARAVERLVGDPSLVRKMGETGVANVTQKWAVEKSVDRLEKNLLEVASS